MPAQVKEVVVHPNIVVAEQIPPDRHDPQFLVRGARRVRGQRFLLERSRQLRSIDFSVRCQGKCGDSDHIGRNHALGEALAQETSQISQRLVGETVARDDVNAKPAIAIWLGPGPRRSGRHRGVQQNRGFNRFELDPMPTNLHLIIGSALHFDGAVGSSHRDIPCAIQEPPTKRPHSEKSLVCFFRIAAVPLR